MNRQAPVNQADTKYLYARIRASAARAARLSGAFEQGSEFTLETWVWRIEKWAAWDNDDIDCGRGLPCSEQLASKTFGPIANDGAPDFPGRCNTKTRGPACIFPDKHGHQSAADFDTRRINRLEVGPSSNVLVRAKPHRSSETVSRLRPLARRRLITC
jgi:hypothetical protein